MKYRKIKHFLCTWRSFLKWIKEILSFDGVFLIWMNVGKYKVASSSRLVCHRMKGKWHFVTCDSSWQIGHYYFMFNVCFDIFRQFFMLSILLSCLHKYSNYVQFRLKILIKVWKLYKNGIFHMWEKMPDKNRHSHSVTRTSFTNYSCLWIVHRNSKESISIWWVIKMKTQYSSNSNWWNLKSVSFDSLSNFIHSTIILWWWNQT